MKGIHFGRVDMRPPTSMRIFLSHSSDDRTFVNNLALDLKSRGFDVWYSEWELGVGDSLVNAIQSGIEKASWLVVVLSPSSVDSRWVREELNAGFARQLAEDRVYILPVLHKTCEMPAFLRDRLYADFRHDYSTGLQKLLWTLSFRYHPETESLLVEEDRGETHKNPVFSVEVTADPLLDSVVKYALEVSHPQFSGMRTPSSYGPLKLAAGFLTYPESLEGSSSLAGLWRGLTGRLRLSVSRNRVKGQYDWLGYEYSGVLTGVIEGQTLIFDWSWSVSGAKGSGVFYHRTPDSLTGGWWFKYEEIDAERLVTLNALPPRHWEFLRSTNSIDLKPQRAKRLPPFPDKTARNKPCPCGSGKKYKHCHGY
jgi:hypothetical protein